MRDFCVDDQDVVVMTKELFSPKSNSRIDRPRPSLQMPGNPVSIALATGPIAAPAAIGLLPSVETLCATSSGGSLTTEPLELLAMRCSLRTERRSRAPQQTTESGKVFFRRVPVAMPYRSKTK